VQFDGERAERVRTAPLVNEHGAEIRRALQARAGWPEAQAARPMASAC
jgi:hypothetical protein